MGLVFDALLDRAKAGDVQAARLLLDALVERDPTRVEVIEHENPAAMPEDERIARVMQFVRIAEGRRAAAEAAEADREDPEGDDAG